MPFPNRDSTNEIFRDRNKFDLPSDGDNTRIDAQELDELQELRVIISQGVSRRCTTCVLI